MNQAKSSMAMLSGIYSSLGLAPHLGFLLLLFFAKMQAPLSFLIITYVASIHFGEYLFYKRVSPDISFRGWLKCALNPRTPGYFLWAYISEVLFDGIFLYLALKFSWNPLNFFLILLGCKFISAPVQVYLSNLYLTKNTGFFLAVPTQILCLFIGDKNPEFFLFALVLKGILCNGIAVARSQYLIELSSQDVSQ